jgi:hypothetical protein
MMSPRGPRSPFKAVLNDALRLGLEEIAPGEPEFNLVPHAGHLRTGIDDRRFNELAWEPEDAEL